MNIQEEARKMKLASPRMASTAGEVRNAALLGIAKALEENKTAIFSANAEDLAAADAAGISAAVKKRLKFDEGKLTACLDGLRQLAELPDPVGRVLLRREMDAGLILTKLSCPIGVIGVIFEARPDALVQISSLCIKSGNCAALKGGKETARTNRALFTLIHAAAVEAGLPKECLLQAELHNEIGELLTCDRDVDLLIPRGSNAFVRYIMDNTKIPVMGHADGICHIYVDKDADQEKALRVIVDAKTQYTAACNAVETVLVDRPIATEFLPKLAKALADAGVELRGSREAAKIVPVAEVMDDDAFAKEYLDLILSAAVVDGPAAAAEHINRFGSHHTDSILTENDVAWEVFRALVDSAGVYRNVSTRFADGFRYGFGAEVGISTSKIHARGPVGLDGLMTYKYLIEGDGQIVGDYASGKAAFHFRDL